MDESLPEATREVAIRLENGAPMRGLVDTGDPGRRVRFVGWLSLLAALERLFDEPVPVDAKRGTK